MNSEKIEKPKRIVLSMDDLNELELIEYQKWIVEKEMATYKQLKEGLNNEV